MRKGTMRFTKEAKTVTLPALSAHAQQRLRQRGYRERDIEMVMIYGTVCADAVVLTDRDVRRAIETKKREIQDLEHLRGTAVIVQDGVVATVYRPDRRRMRRFLSRRRGRSGEE